MKRDVAVFVVLAAIAGLLMTLGDPMDTVGAIVGLSTVVGVATVALAKRLRRRP